MKTVFILVALAGAMALPDDAEQAIVEIEKLGGEVRRAENLPGRPVIAVDLPGCSVSGGFLKIAHRFPRLEWLDL